MSIKNAEYYGYKVGDKFTVNSDYPYDDDLQGELVTMIYDDESINPQFRKENGGNTFITLEYITPKMKNYREMKPKDEVDLEIDGVKIPCNVETLLYICHALGCSSTSNLSAMDTWESLNKLLMGESSRVCRVTKLAPFKETSSLTLKPNVNDGFFLDTEKDKRKKEIEDKINSLQEELTKLKDGVNKL